MCKCVNDEQTNGIRVVQSVEDETLRAFSVLRTCRLEHLERSLLLSVGFGVLAGSSDVLNA